MHYSWIIDYVRPLTKKQLSQYVSCVMPDESFSWSRTGNPMRGHFMGASSMIRSNQKIGERITPSKDRIKATLKSGFYLRGAGGGGGRGGIKVKPALLLKLICLPLEKVTILEFSLAKPLKRK